MPGPRRPESDQEEIKADWKDFVALVIAAYSLLLPPLLIVIGVTVVVFLLFYLVF
jgi:hypothetical protein